MKALAPCAAVAGLEVVEGVEPPGEADEVGVPAPGAEAELLEEAGGVDDQC